MSSTGDEVPTAASGEQIRPPVEEGRDAELASLQRQISQLAALVEESVKKKEPGSVVADAASSGGWVAATGGQDQPLQPHRGGGAFFQQARDGGQGPQQLLEGGWASRSGANPARPAGVGPGIGPDYGEARGLNPPGEIPVIRGNGEYLDGYGSSHQKRVTVNAPLLDGKSRSHGFDSWRKSFIQAAKTIDLDGQFIGDAETNIPVGDPNLPTSELLRRGYTRAEVQRGLQAFHFITTAVVQEADKAIVSKCTSPKEVLAELEKVYDPESQGSKQALMRKMFDFAIPSHNNSNPIEHLYSLELLYARLREKGLNAEQPFVLAHFVGSLPPEYQQAKFLLETATALDRAEIVRIVSTVHASLPEGRKASKGQRRAEHALLASDGGGGGGAPGRGNSGRRKGGGGGGGNQKGRGGGAKDGGSSGGGDDDAGSMRGRCFRCGKKGHQVANCSESKPVRCETCKGYGHDKSKCPTEEAVLVVEVRAGGASADATALDVAEEALVVGDISGECHKVVGRGGVEQARRGRYVADTGATTHMFANSDGFVRYEECDRRVRVAAGETFPIVGYGDVTVTLSSRDGTTDLLLKRVAHVPRLDYNLVSLTSLFDDGFETKTLNKHELELERGGGEVVYFPRCGNLYVQNGFRTHTEHACAAIAPGNAKASSTPVDINDFHRAHGHSHEVLLRTTAKQQGTTLVGDLRECLGCSTRRGFPSPSPTRRRPEQIFMVAIWNAFKTSYDSETAWRLSFLVPAAIVFCVAVGQLFLADDSPKGNYKELEAHGAMTRKSSAVSFKKGYMNVNSWLMFLQYAACFGVELTVNNVAANYFSDEFDLSTSKAGLVASLFGLMNLFARSLGGIWSDFLFAKFGGGVTGMRGRFFAQWSALLWEGCFLFLFTFMNQLGAAIPILILFSVGVQMAEGTSYGIVPYIVPDATGAVSGIVGAGGNFGAVMWGLIFRFAGRSERAVFRIIAAFVVGLSCLTPLLKIRGYASCFGAPQGEPDSIADI